MPNLNRLNVVFLSRDRSLALCIQTLDYREAHRASAFAQALGKHMLTTVRRSTTKHAGTSGSSFHPPARFKKMTRVTSFRGVIEPLWCAAMSFWSVEKRTAL
mgnify:CR=1 FL=1